MPTAPEPVLATGQAFLATRWAAPDAAAHLALLAPDLPLVLGDRAVPAAEVDPVALGTAWRAAAATPDRMPRLSGAPGAPAWRPDGEDRGVLDLPAHDATDDRAWLVRLGLVRGDGGWRVAFEGLAEPVAEPPAGYAEARLAALAELASVRAMAATAPVASLIDVAWHRRARLPRHRLLALPETAFSCAGSGVCCTHDLTIGIDENARQFLEGVDWPALVPHAPAAPYLEALPEAAAGLVSFRHRLAREAGGRCKFLTPDDRCAIHALVGRAVFKPCHVFPYRFAWTPDGVCVTTNAMCPTARACQGASLADQEPDLRARLAVADVLRAERFYLRAGEEVPWPVFRTIEGQLLELLNGDYPVKRKLWVALRWLKARLEDPEAGVAARWYDEPAPRLGFMGRLAFRRFPTLFDPCFRDLAGVAPGEGIWPEHEEVLGRWFRSLLFSKALTYPYGLVAGLNYLAMVTAVLERQIDRHARRGISEAFWREFFAVVTSGTFGPILQAIHQRPATGYARHAGAPDFGLALLRLYDEVPRAARQAE